MGEGKIGQVTFEAIEEIEGKELLQPLIVTVIPLKDGYSVMHSGLNFYTVGATKKQALEGWKQKVASRWRELDQVETLTDKEFEEWSELANFFPSRKPVYIQE